MKELYLGFLFLAFAFAFATANRIRHTMKFVWLVVAWLNLVVLDAMVLNYSLPQVSHLKPSTFFFLIFLIFFMSSTLLLFF